MKKIILLLIILFPIAANAYEFMTPQSMAIGDAYLSKSLGFHAVNWNPAKLGLTQPNTINIFQFNTNLNNSTLDYQYLKDIDGLVMNNNDKKDFLDRIPDNGFPINAQMGIAPPILGLSVNHWGLAVQSCVTGNISLDKDYFELLLYGNEYDKYYDFPDNKGEVVAYAEARLGYGQRIPMDKIFPRITNLPPIYGGISLGIITGFAYAKLENVSSSVVANDNGISFDQKVVIKSAGYSRESIEDEDFDIMDCASAAGKGFRADISFYSPLSSHLTVSFAIRNIAGSISWNDDCEKTTFSVTGENLFFANEDFDDSLIVDVDTTNAIQSFSQSIPMALHAGASFELHHFHLYGDILQGFKKSAFTSGVPKFSLGMEYYPTSWVPVRCGVAFGGDRPAHFSFGSGLEFKNYEFSWAVRSYKTPFPMASKGIGMAMGMLVKF